MKKLIALLFVICTICCTFIGCNKNASVKATLISVSEHTIVIRVDQTNDNAKLSDALKSVKGETFNYEMQSGMITSINGISNKADWSYSWMIYTNDTDFSNTAWGTVVYDNITYGSATLGADALPVTQNCYYILNYTSF